MAQSPCSLTETIVDGRRWLTVENEFLRVGINVDHGTHIHEISDQRNGTNLLYQDPKGSSDYDIGGWYELFPNAGAACEFDGVRIPTHGDIQHGPWTYELVEATDDRIELGFSRDSTILPFHVEKTISITADQPALSVAETITNVGTDTLPYLWGHHVTFGKAFVLGSRVDLPDTEVYGRDRASNLLADNPRGRFSALPGADGNPIDMSLFPETVFSAMLFTDPLAEYWYNVYNSSLGTGFALAWDGDAFPFLWIWQENGRLLAEPYEGNVVAMGLEPQACEVPTLTNAVAAGRAPVLAPGESRSSWVTASIHDRPEIATNVDAKGVVTFA